MLLNFQQFNIRAAHPLLILHVLLGDQGNWYPQAQILANDRWVITADLQ